MKKETGGAAFPHDVEERYQDVYGEAHTSEYSEPGMTLRDYFAAKAMQAMITGYLSNEKSSESGFKFYEGDHLHAAKAAYAIADAMLKERKK